MRQKDPGVQRVLNEFQDVLMGADLDIAESTEKRKEPFYRQERNMMQNSIQQEKNVTQNSIQKPQYLKKEEEIAHTLDAYGEKK